MVDPSPSPHGDIPGIFGSIGLPRNDRNLFIVSLSSALVQLSLSLWVWCTTMGILKKFEERELLLESQPEGLNVFAQREKRFQMTFEKCIVRSIKKSTKLT